VRQLSHEECATRYELSTRKTGKTAKTMKSKEYNYEMKVWSAELG